MSREVCEEACGHLVGGDGGGVVGGWVVVVGCGGSRCRRSMGVGGVGGAAALTTSSLLPLTATMDARSRGQGCGASGASPDRRDHSQVSCLRAAWRGQRDAAT